MTDQKEFDDLIEKLELLKDVPSRKEGSATRGKQQFLASAQTPVSPWGLLRLNPYIRTLIIGMALVVGFLGTSGILVASAHATLPSDPLYSVKLWWEDVQLGLAGDAEGLIDLHLDFAEERLDEIKRIDPKEKEEIFDLVVINLEKHLDEAGDKLGSVENEQLNLRYAEIEQQYESLVGGGGENDVEAEEEPPVSDDLEDLDETGDIEEESDEDESSLDETEQSNPDSSEEEPDEDSSGHDDSEEDDELDDEHRDELDDEHRDDEHDEHSDEHSDEHDDEPDEHDEHKDDND